MRRRNVKNIDERLQNATPLVVLNGTSLKGKWQSLFGNDNPIYLEIGMGKGDFIIEHAKSHPEINFLGLEKYPSVLIQAVDKLKGVSLPNLYFIPFDATNLLDLFLDNEIAQIYLNFSDPWPKTRHAKRRLTSHQFLKQYEQVLNNDGLIQFKTDNQHLFEYSILEMNAYHMNFLDLSFDLHHRVNKEKVITTEYEKKFMAKNNPIYFLKAGFSHGK